MRRIVREKSLSGRALESHVIVGRILPGSWAEYLALWANLRQRDKERSIEGMIAAAKRRKDYLRAHLETHGEIVCAYCGKLGLTIAQAGQKRLSMVATVDHFISTSMGGADDESNYVPSCRRCNSNKSSTMPIEVPKHATPDVADRLTRTLADPPYMTRVLIAWDR